MPAWTLCACTAVFLECKHTNLHESNLPQWTIQTLISAHNSTPPTLLSYELLQYGQSTSGHSAVKITEKWKCLGCPPSACQHGSRSALNVYTVIRGNIAQLPTPQRLWARWIPRKRDECGCYVTPCLWKEKFSTTLTCCLSDTFPACTTMTRIQFLF
jgi:hypothetical protein